MGAPVIGSPELVVGAVGMSIERLLPARSRTLCSSARFKRRDATLILYRNSSSQMYI